MISESTNSSWTSNGNSDDADAQKEDDSVAVDILRDFIFQVMKWLFLNQIRNEYCCIKKFLVCALQTNYLTQKCVHI